MKVRGRMVCALAVVLALCLVPLPAGAEETHTHSWRTDWATDDYHHWHGCTDPDCRTLVPGWAEGYGYHSYDNAWDRECNVCGWARAVDPGHTHTWGGEGWTSDETHHWRQCADPDCPGVVPSRAEGYGAHAFNAEGNCSVCGSSRIPDLNHAHVWGVEWDGDREGHWYRCTAPGCPGVVPGQAAGYGLHVYADSGAAECSVCGQVRYVDPNHTHTWGEMWRGDDQFHWRACTGGSCPGVVPGQAADYGLHVYTDSGTAECSVCGRARHVDPNHTHVWGTEWTGNDNFHWYQCVAGGCPGVVPGEGEGCAVHVYDGSLDTDCNICGRVRVALPPSKGDLNAPADADPRVTIVGRGRLAVRPVSPQPGEKATVVLTPEKNYAAGSLTVTDRQGRAVEAVDNGDGTWSFLLPEEEVRFRAVFPPAYLACARDEGCPADAYEDLSPEQWYHDGIHYCLNWGIMGGYDPVSFCPDERMSGGMLAQTLYNLAGQPETPGGSVYQGTGAWYDGAVTWAVGAGVMNVDDGFWKFSPGEDITREQMVLTLWRYAGRPTAAGQLPPFADARAVSFWAADAVRWAVDGEILHGKENGILDPQGKITRAEAAAMLVRFLEGPAL